MDGQYDYIKISTPELMGDFMTKDLDRNYEHFTIESRGFLSKNVLKKDGQIFKFNGPLTIYSHQGEYTLWIRDGLVIDMITSYKKEEIKEEKQKLKPMGLSAKDQREIIKLTGNTEANVTWFDKELENHRKEYAQQREYMQQSVNIVMFGSHSEHIADHYIDIKDEQGRCIKCGRPESEHLLSTQ